MDLGENPEGAVDEGGPTIEFCRLLMNYLKSRSLFGGPDHFKLLALNSQGKHLVIQGSNPCWKYVSTMKF